MLDQFRHDLSNDSNDSNQDSRFQMSRKRFVYTLSAAALALVLFLFLIGAFRNDSAETLVGTGSPDNSRSNKQEENSLDKLQARITRLEELVSKQNLSTNAAEHGADLNIAFTDDSLKQLIDQQNPLDSIAFSMDAESLDEQPMPNLVPSNVVPVSPGTTPKPAPSATPAPTPKSTAPTKSYVVQKGDTLTKISQKLFGTTKRWKEIYDLNSEKITNMNQLKVGTKLMIPEK